MPSITRTVRLGAVFLFIYIGLNGLAKSLHVAYAASAQTKVKAELCSAAIYPVITIAQPQSDSVISSPSVTVLGTAENTSQLDVSVDGVYSHSVGIGSDEAFTTTVSLSQGTHTIAFAGYYSCNQESRTVTLVLTYGPQTTPTEERPSTEVIPPGQTKPGIVSNPQAEGRAEAELSWIDRIKIKLGFGDDGKTGLYHDYVVPIASWSIVFLAFVLALAVLLPPHIVAWLFRRLGKEPPRWYHKLSARLVAALLVGLFVTILQA